MPNFTGDPDQFIGNPESTWKDYEMEKTPVERLKSLGAEVQRMQEQMREAAKQAVAEGTKAIFDEYGDLIVQFGWLQYTPYFNDGDPCEFGMHDLFVIGRSDLEELKGEHEGEYDFDKPYDFYCALSDEDWYYEGSPSFSGYGSTSKRKQKVWDYNSGASREVVNPNFDQRYQDAYEACMAIYNVCSADGQQIAKDIFGDHVRVIFTPSGVDVEEYEHD